MKRKMSWRSLKFIPAGGDESQAITRKHKGFMHLCEVYRYYIEHSSGYSIDDTKGMFTKYGYNNVDVSWSDFRLALAKYSVKSPPEKPSVFCGESYGSEHTLRMRKRLLASVLREYTSAQFLADDILEWLARGKEDDIRRFAITILHGIGWLRERPTTIDAALVKSIERPEGTTLMMG